MPRQGNGTYVLPAGNPVTPSTLIRSEWANSTLTDIGNALSQSISKDGQTNPTADLPMGGFKHTNVDQSDAVGQYAESRQVQNWEFMRLVNGAGTTGTAYLCTLVLGSNSWDNGTSFIFAPTVSNTGPATLSVNGGTALPILSSAGLPLVAGDIIAGTTYYIRILNGSWYLVPFTSVGGTGDYVLKTGDTMTGNLTIAPPAPASAAFAVVASGGGTAYVSIGYPLRAPGGVPYTLDNGRFGEAYTVTYNSQDQQSIRLIASTSVSTLDCVPMNTDGSVKAVASNPFLFRLNNAAGVLFTAVTIDNQGSITANFQITGRLFKPAHLVTSISVATQVIDCATYQSWYLQSLAGNTTLNLTNLTSGQVVRIIIANGPGYTVNWQAAGGAENIVWPNSTGNLPPTGAEMTAGPLEHCVFTFWKFLGAYIVGQWAAY